MPTLRDLGLSEYETRAYRGLLRNAPTTAKELSRSSDVPMGRIYDVLNALESAGLVRSQSTSRPKKYVAVEPETALDRLLAEKKRELRERASQYEAVVEELAAELDLADPDEGRFWTVAVGPEQTLDLLVERLAAADEHILLAAGMPSPQFDLGDVGERVATALEEALDGGVAVTILLTPELVETLPSNVQRRYTNRLASDPNFEARTHADIDGTFNLIDSTEVCIEVPNPLNPGEAFAMMDFKDPTFAADVRETFDARWENAETLALGS